MPSVSPEASDTAICFAAGRGEMGRPQEKGATLLLGVPRETLGRETRGAATPATVIKLCALGYGVVVESQAGLSSSFPDEAYAAAGARVGTAEEAWQADVV